jgi:hypothetical protein
MATPTIAMIPSGYKAGTVYSVLPVDGTGDLTFTRAGTKTRINQSQAIESLATGVPSIDYTGGGCPSLLLEPQQTQLYGETATMATQTKTVTAVEHTVGFYGTGTITFTGTYAGSLVGTGINDRVELTFTPTAGSLISTVSGSVTSSQLVTGDYLGSYIPNTTTGTRTRIADAASKTGLSSYINSSEGVLYAEIAALTEGGATATLSISDGSLSNRVLIVFSSGELRGQFTNSSGTSTIDTSGSVIKDFNKVACVYTSTTFKLFVNGTQISGTATVTSLTGLNKISFDRGDGVLSFEGRVKELRVYSTALTDTELITLTTL